MTDEKRPITKSLILSHRQCPKKAWLEWRGTETVELGLSDIAAIQQGFEVQACARSSYDSGRLVPVDLPIPKAAEITASLLKEQRPSPIYEATFVGDVGGTPVGVRVDVLESVANTVSLVEIKSGGSVSPAYLDDVAIQFATVESALVNSDFTVADALVMHPSTALKLDAGGSGQDVFVRESVLAEVRVRIPGVMMWAKACAETLVGDMPDCAPGSHCSAPYACGFTEICGTPVVDADPDLVAYLPSKSSPPVQAAISAGATRISQIPVSALINERNALVHSAVVERKVVVVPDFARATRELPFPRYFLDFEAAGFAIPRFVGMSPYQAVTFQWSCHIQGERGAALTHLEFLDVSGNDPRRGFAESLIRAVGASGPVIVYSGYERARLTELAAEFPELAASLSAVSDRLVDYLPMARRGYYAPAMCGSWSIKAIAPTLPPCAELESYAELDVADGVAAQAAYRQQTDPVVPLAVKEAQRQNMLRYCRADTRGLAHFVQVVEDSLNE